MSEPNQFPTGSRNQRSLRNLLLNPAYQLRYIFWISATGLALVTINAAIFYYFTKENYLMLVELSPMTDAAKELLYSELHRIAWLLAIASTAFVVISSVFALVTSHRTVGPLYHFNKVFKQIAAGDTSARIRLRPNDDFKDVAASFNAMMDAMKDQLGKR